MPADLIEAPTDFRYCGYDAIDASFRGEQALEHWAGPPALLLPGGSEPLDRPWIGEFGSLTSRAVADSGLRRTQALLLHDPNSDVPFVAFGLERRTEPDTTNEGISDLSPLPLLLELPEPASQCFGIGSLVWNARNQDAVEVHGLLTELLKRRRTIDGPLYATIRNLLSDSGYGGYTIPHRLTSPRLGVERYNRLLEYAEAVGLKTSIRLSDEHFFPGSISRYSNPYRYQWRRWTADNGAGRVL